MAGRILAGGALLLGLVLWIFAQGQAPQSSAVVEGKDKPILLAKVVVSATVLPERPSAAAD